MDTKNKKGHDFRTLWLKERWDATAAHQLFYKLHSVKKQEPEYPRGQTLFVLNIPPTTTEIVFKKMLKKEYPSVSLVKFVSQPDSHPSTFKNAYVVFDEETEIKQFLSLPSEYTFTLYNESHPGVFGIKKWCKEYNKSLSDEAKLQIEVESYMRNYDKRMKQKKLKESEAEKEDEDGWVTVTGKKKRGQYATARKESTIQKLKEKNEIKKKKELVNIYAFQIREAKKERLVELRKKFEQDKAKVQLYKQKRKFRPF